MPDRLLLRPDGTAAFVEFKRPGQRPTKIQAYRQNYLRGMGFTAVVVTNVHAFTRLLTLTTK
jgi:hypothetical protein